MRIWRKFALGAVAAVAVAALVVGGARAAVMPSPTVQFPTTAWNGYAPAYVQCGELLGANMNTTADQPIYITSPTALYDIFAIEVSNASVSMTTAAGGVYPSKAKAGDAIVASSQAYSALTAAATNATGSTVLLTVSSDAAGTAFNLPVLYFSLTTAQGAPATADIRVRCAPLYK